MVYKRQIQSSPYSDTTERSVQQGTNAAEPMAQEIKAANQSTMYNMCQRLASNGLASNVCCTAT
jgi:hypothetical protein